MFASISGNDAVLGPAKVEGIQLTENGIPFEQAVCRQKLRPGSGFLSVNITTDGPTRVIEITDIKDRVRSSHCHHVPISFACLFFLYYVAENLCSGQRLRLGVCR